MSERDPMPKCMFGGGPLSGQKIAVPHSLNHFETIIDGQRHTYERMLIAGRRRLAFVYVGSRPAQ
jgi:hypothetical protein